jgi:hypothetical protein
LQPKDHPIITVPKDGIYFLFVTVRSDKNEKFVVHIEMQSRHGYLSAADWPLLPVIGIAVCNLMKF